MRKFETIINKLKVRQNIIIIARESMVALMLLIAVFICFMLFYYANNLTPRLNFMAALSTKVFTALSFLYLGMRTINMLIKQKAAAYYLDNFNSDKADTYQNAWELLQKPQANNPEILAKIFDKADKKADKQLIKADISKLKTVIFPFIMVSLALVTIIFILPQKTRAAWEFFQLRNVPLITHKKTIEVDPPGSKVKKYSDYTISVINPEETEHTLYYKIDKLWRQTPCNYEKTFYKLDYSFSYYLKNAYAVSDTFMVQVYDNPAVTKWQVRYNYPAYTGLPTLIDTTGTGHLKALASTVVSLITTCNNPIQSSRIIFDDDTVIAMKRQTKKSFSAEFKITKSQQYYIMLEDILNNKSAKINKNIQVLYDLAPQIDIISPLADTTLTQNMLIPIRLVVSDDYGLHRLMLRYWLNGTEKEVLVHSSFADKHANLSHLFDLSNEIMLPGDVVVYQLEISDNSPAHQVTVSGKLRTRFPSIEEIYKELEAEEAEKIDDLQKNKIVAQEQYNELDKKHRELMKKDKADWQDKKDLEKVLDNQEKLNEDVDKIAQDYQEMLEKLADNQAMNEETMQKMQKIKELMEEIANDAMRESMQKMQDAMDKMDPEMLKKAMENLKFSLSDFMEKLDRTVDLLEKIKKEQALNKAAEIAKEMLEMQEALNEKTDKSNKISDMAGEQAKIQKKMESLRQEMQKADSLLTDAQDQAIKEKMQAAMEEMNEDMLPADLMDSQQSMQENQKQAAQKSQQAATKKMQKMKESLEQMQSMMSAGGQQEMGEGVDLAIQRLLVFSQLHKASKNSYADDPYMILGQQIDIFEGIKNTINQLYQVPMIVMMLSPKFAVDTRATINTYTAMFQEINDAKSNHVEKNLAQIAGGINLMIWDLMQSSPDQSGGGGSAMQQMQNMMQQMGQQQMMMNSLTQQMMQQMMSSGGKPSSKMRGQMQKMAADEQRLADNLKRMLHENSAAQKQAGALNKLIEELESIANELHKGRLTNELINRQNKILSRLLDAQKSVNKRDKSKKRKAETNYQDDWQLSPQTIQKFKEIQRKAMLKNMQSYTPAQQEAIKEYMKKLNEKTFRAGAK